MIFDSLIVEILVIFIVLGTLFLGFIKHGPLAMAGVVIIVFVVEALGWNFIKQDKLSYNEYWNGYETQAVWNKTACDRDGYCHHSYNCDPYQVFHPAITDDKGNTISPAYTTTEYHQCPFTTEEWQFIVKTTLGDYEIAGANLPTNPDSYRFRSDRSVPSDIPSGIPAFWQAAADRINAGKPGPVTKRMQYDNYILASDTTILNEYSDKIKEFLAANILPKIVNNIHDFYYADKVYFVGYKPTEDWYTPAAYLDAAFGTELQGDLHLVIIQSSIADANPEAYLEALKAYWTDNRTFGKDTISKNGVIVILGTDGQTVTWARAITGMPLGNEGMIQAIEQRLKGAQLSTSVILGSMGGQFYQSSSGKTKVKAIHSTGLLDNILWGIDTPGTKFARISMSAKDSTDHGTGFLYLSDLIRPDDSQRFFISLFALLLSLVWLGGVKYWEESDRGYSGFYY